MSKHELIIRTSQMSQKTGGEYCIATCSCGWMVGGQRLTVEKEFSEHVSNDPGKDFWAWAARGPALAKEAGLTVEIKVSEPTPEGK